MKFSQYPDRFLQRPVSLAINNLPQEPSESDSKRLAWQVVSTGTGLQAAVLTQRALTAWWTRYVGVPDVGPPNPADRRINWSEAIIWAVAVGAVSALPNGVYIAMNGRLFDPFKCRKNREKRMFEEV